MKSRIIQFVALCFILTNITVNAMAQDQEKQKPKLTAEQRADMRVSHLKEKLNLTPEQSSKMRELLLAQEKIREADIKEVKESRQKMIGEMENILTPQQMAKFKELQEKQKEKMEAKFKRKNGESPGQPEQEK